MVALIIDLLRGGISTLGVGGTPHKTLTASWSAIVEMPAPHWPGAV